MDSYDTRELLEILELECCGSESEEESPVSFPCASFMADPSPAGYQVSHFTSPPALPAGRSGRDDRSWVLKAKEKKERMEGIDWDECDDERRKENRKRKKDVYLYTQSLEGRSSKRQRSRERWLYEGRVRGDSQADKSEDVYGGQGRQWRMMDAGTDPMPLSPSLSVQPRQRSPRDRPRAWPSGYRQAIMPGSSVSRVISGDADDETILYVDTDEGLDLVEFRSQRSPTLTAWQL